MATPRGGPFYARLGGRLRSLRIRAGLSQAAVGARLGRSASAIDRYEMGQRRIAVADLLSLAGILDVPVQALLGTAGLGRRRAAAPAAARSAIARLRAEHLRLLRALGRHLLDPDAAGQNEVAEPARGYRARRRAAETPDTDAPGAKIPRRRLRQWARQAGLPMPGNAEALGRFAALIVAWSVRRSDPRRPRLRRAPR